VGCEEGIRQWKVYNAPQHIISTPTRLLTRHPQSMRSKGLITGLLVVGYWMLKNPPLFIFHANNSYL